MQKKKIRLVAAGLILASLALVVGQSEKAASEKASPLKVHGSLSTGANRYQVSVTTSEGKIVFVQPPHTKFYYEARSLYPTANRKQLVRSFYCQGEALLVMTQYGKRIMSMTVNKATVEVDDLPK